MFIKSERPKIIDFDERSCCILCKNYNCNTINYNKCRWLISLFKNNIYIQRIIMFDLYSDAKKAKLFEEIAEQYF